MHSTWGAGPSRAKTKASAARGTPCATRPARRSSSCAATRWTCPPTPTSAPCWATCPWSSASTSATWTWVSRQQERLPPTGLSDLPLTPSSFFFFRCRGAEPERPVPVSGRAVHAANHSVPWLRPKHRSRQSQRGPQCTEVPQNHGGRKVKKSKKKKKKCSNSVTPPATQRDESPFWTQEALLWSI